MSDNPELDRLVAAAGNADAVRLAAVVAAMTDAGTEQVTRDLLVTAWSQQWRHHLYGPRKPAQRVQRSLPVLIGVDAMTSIAGPYLRVRHTDVLHFLADRLYLADALDVQAPTSNTLPVGQSTIEQAAELVDAHRPGHAQMRLSGTAAVVRGGRVSGAAGDMRLSATADVVKGGAG